MTGRERLRAVVSGLLAAVFMWLLLFAPTPYVIYEPGLAIPLSGMISAEEQKGEASSSEGEFLMTTVKMTSANYWRAVSSLWNANIDVYSRKSVMGNDTNEEYSARMSIVMLGSQNDAVEAAYRFAGIAYQAVSQQVVITGAAEDSVLQPGDVILREGNGRSVVSLAELAGITDRAAQQGGAVSLVIARQGQEVAVEVPIGVFSPPLKEDGLTAALGVTGLSEQRKLVPDDAVNGITVDAGEVGGPSAGLMFALEAVDLLTPGDLTRGLTVAGTGTINAAGEVGAIGGVSHKVAAAGEQGAELFLAPSANAEEAAEKAASIGTPMKVVGVDTLEDAVAAIEAYSRSGS